MGASNYKGSLARAGITKCAALMAVLLVTIGGCAPKVTTPPLEHRIGQNVNYNVLAECNVGDVIFTQYEYYGLAGATLIERVSQGAALGRIEIPAGEPLEMANVNGKNGYCTRVNRYIDPMYGPFRIVCLFDNANNNHFDTLWYCPGMVPFTSSITPQVLYRKSEMGATGTGFKYELLYEGMDKGTIHITYREFTDNMIRPAFQQDVTYGLNNDGPTMVTFRKTKIEIISADNNTVKYRVLSGFN